MDGSQKLAGPGMFAGLTTRTDQDWTAIREQSQAASRTSKAQRSA
jgi:hypothetical protein